MNTRKSIIQLNQVNDEILSPKQFINLKERDKANISFTEIIPVRLGHSGFGKIKVHYKRPVYK